MKPNPVVLVTGASRGLGRGIARSCAGIGCNVAIHYQGNEAAARETLELCEEAAVHPQQEFTLAQGNLASAADRTRLFEQTLSSLGRLDALVNNSRHRAAGARRHYGDGRGKLRRVLMSVNLKGPYFLSQLAARHWLKHPNKSSLPAGYKLIFIGSISADTASVNRGEYCLSKAGLSMACQLWATWLAGDSVLRVFEIRPGMWKRT